MSAKRPLATVRSMLMQDDQLWFERHDDDCADAVLRFFGGYDGDVLATAETETVDEEEDGGEGQEVVLEEQEEEDDDGEMIRFEDEEDEEIVEGRVYEWTDQEESDDDDDEKDEESEVSGFMRIAAADGENQEEGGGDTQILVLYRYTRFSAAWSDGSVEVRGSTREHQLRFMAAAGHGARSLAWAGASLAHLIYPGGCCKQLRELWRSLASEASLPPGAARVKVFVEVGILPRENCTQVSMGHMLAALEEMMARPWPGRFTGMVLNQPEPMRCAHDEDNDTDGEHRPAKRRRVVTAGDNCSVCLDHLEGDDLAAWPGCGKPDVFHGRCLELALESKKPLCPVCRRGLYIEPTF